jgi:hypothetical protein
MRLSHRGHLPRCEEDAGPEHVSDDEGDHGGEAELAAQPTLTEGAAGQVRRGVGGQDEIVAPASDEKGS